jgi:hypothetical protein
MQTDFAHATMNLPAINADSILALPDWVGKREKRDSYFESQCHRRRQEIRTPDGIRASLSLHQPAGTGFVHYTITHL